MPVRKIGVSARSVTWDFESVKTDSTHRCESTLEFEYLYLVEFDPLVRTFEAQPIAIPFVNGEGKKTRYIPDFKLVYTKHGAELKGYEFSLIEIKYQNELNELMNLFSHKFRAAEIYCDSQGGKFEIVDERAIKTQRLLTCKFLHRYLHPDKVPKLKLNCLELAQGLNTFTPKDWVDHIGGSELMQGQALSNLWHLVATGRLETDFDSQITMQSIIKFVER